MTSSTSTASSTSVSTSTAQTTNPTEHWLDQHIEETREQLRTQRLAWKLFMQSLLQAVRNPWRWKEITKHTVQLGIGSLPIVVVATAFSGLIITGEMGYYMREALGNVSLIPGFSGQFIFRELGVAIPALLMVSKVGAAITAEVGTMKISDQIDALKLLKVDLVGYLVLPRLIACIISLVCLTQISIMVTLIFAASVAVEDYNFTWLEYLSTFQKFVSPVDLACAVSKSVVFGAVIPMFGVAYGLRCQGGAEGVGTATTNSVVASTIAIIVWDFVLTFWFSMFY